MFFRKEICKYQPHITLVSRPWLKSSFLYHAYIIRFENIRSSNAPLILYVKELKSKYKILFIWSSNVNISCSRVKKQYIKNIFVIWIWVVFYICLFCGHQKPQRNTETRNYLHTWGGKNKQNHFTFTAVAKLNGKKKKGNVRVFLNIISGNNSSHNNLKWILSWYVTRLLSTFKSTINKMFHFLFIINK